MFLIETQFRKNKLFLGVQDRRDAKYSHTNAQYRDATPIFLDQTQVVFTNFLQEFSREFARALGGSDPLLDQKIRSTILTSPLREKFSEKLAKVAQS